MRIDVYTYYRNRLALERASGQIRRRRGFPMPAPRLSPAVLRAVLAGTALLGLALLDPAAAPLLALVPLLLAAAGLAVRWARSRGRLVAAALEGRPLGEEGIRSLLER